MSRYIDAEWIRNVYADFEHYENRDDWTTPIANVLAVIDDAPSIEIIRCRECKWNASDGCFFSTADRTLDDFCSYGCRSGKPNNCEDEPQTDLVNDSQVLVKDLVDDEFNPYDEECMRCKHLKLKCEFIPTYCKFESRDEPQTERSE